MNRTTLLRFLKQTKDHVAIGERHIARRREIIAECEKEGHSTEQAISLLGGLEATQRLYVAHRDRLLKDVAQNSK